MGKSMKGIGAIKGTATSYTSWSTKKLDYPIQCWSSHYRSHQSTYNELGLESLEFRWHLRKLCLFFKIKKTGLPKYLFNMTPQNNHQYNIRSSEDVTTFYYKPDVFKYSYFLHTILEWNKIDMQIRRCKYLSSFKNSLLKIGWLTAKPA